MHGALRIVVILFVVWMHLLTPAAEDDAGKATIPKTTGRVNLTFDQLPAVVKTSFTKLAGGAPLFAIRRAMENGRVVYVSEYKKGGVERRMTVDTQGNLLRVVIEKEKH